MQQQDMERRNGELAEKLKEKTRSEQKLRVLYQQIKGQQLSAGIELAAEHDAENALHAAGHDATARHGGQPLQSRAGSNGSSGRSRTIDAWHEQVSGSRAGLQTSRRFFNVRHYRSID